MNEKRAQELYEADVRIAKCGCGGVCEPCEKETRPTDEELPEYEAWLEENDLV